MEQSKSAAAVLSATREFRDITPQERQALAESCRWHRYAEGELVVEHRDVTNGVFIVAAGIVRVLYYSLSGRELIFADVQAGDMFGELSAIDGKLRSATVIAKRESQLVSIPAAAFLEIVHTNKNVATAMLKRLSGKVRYLSDRLADVSTLPVRNRIHVELLRLAQGKGAGMRGAMISPVPTHAEIANRVSTHREAVTRELNYLWRCGLIEQKSRDLIIKDVEKLVHMVEKARGFSAEERAIMEL